MPNKAKTVNLIINPAAVIKRNAKGQFTQQPPRDVRDPVGDAHRPTIYGDDVQAIADQWLEQKIENKEIAWLEELCISLYISEDTLWHWANDTDDKNNLIKPKFSETIARALAWQKMILKNNGISGKFNGRMSMFLLSANHDTIEKKEVKADHTSGGKPIDMTGIPTATDEGVNEFITQGLKQKYVRPAR